MKNRNRLNNTCMYDLMLKVSERAQMCPIILFGDVCPERMDNDVDCRIPSDCKECVQKWLNEEEKTIGRNIYER